MLTHPHHGAMASYAGPAMPADPPLSTPGPAAPSAPTSMLELGAALGSGAWWCDQIFTVAGGWVPVTPEAGVRAHLAELSRVVGGHGVALRRHLPRPTGTDPEDWVAPPLPGSPGVVKALGSIEGSSARLAGLHRGLVPRLLVAWEAHRRGASLADRGVARSLSHAHDDLAELWHEGEGLLQASLGAEQIRAAASASEAVETALVASGGLLGPVPDRPPTGHVPSP